MDPEQGMLLSERSTAVFDSLANCSSVIGMNDPADHESRY